VFLEHKCREWETALLAGELKDADFGRWVSAMNTLTGLAKTLGLERRNVTSLDLQTYLAEREDA